MSLEEAIRKDIEHDLELIRNSEDIIVDDAFYYSNFLKEPVDTKRLKDATYIETSGNKVKVITIDVARRVYPLEDSDIIARRDVVTTLQTAEYVIYGLLNHAPYGLRDFPLKIAETITEYIDNKEVTINVSDI